MLESNPGVMWKAFGSHRPTRDVAHRFALQARDDGPPASGSWQPRTTLAEGATLIFFFFFFVFFHFLCAPFAAGSQY
jgi:hypothetical protein